EVWQQQQEWNGATVHLLNELIEYISKTSAQTRRLLHEQILFFQQITPWIDTKLTQSAREQRLDTEQTLAQLSAMLGGADPKQIISHFFLLKSQLYETNLSNERRLNEIVAALGGHTPAAEDLTRIKLE